MLYDNIMVPYDGSPSAEAALREALRFAKDDPGAALHIVQLVDLEKVVIDALDAQGDGKPATSEGLRALRDQAAAEADERLRHHVGANARNLMNRFVISVLEETAPGEQIVSYATDNNCDLIIMGSRGLGVLRGMLGSVSSHVLREADMPVLVLKAD